MPVSFFSRVRQALVSVAESGMNTVWFGLSVEFRSAIANISMRKLDFIFQSTMSYKSACKSWVCMYVCTVNVFLGIAIITVINIRRHH